ncbi:TraR/DksA C4-type zinc finger protein [Paenibacillus sp. TRM 82003]|uniref:TraR/DksA family transcriptional regulator n=1 Tax=Kineococcus sp. TRM81007 TaxID=2925831 RepID=UPI001F57D460|nr:TraR/DksA C4-type zinc finger protein [Kineococcus sp. TRM81007]MCI2240241.1 TraR/DksA C4-type zinc finger protein [Kineococcus sp. TRM81007]MCI3927581.1 TraR/DksA C4-type zinc finger protein [Paenibacillus sp. TRM 82003]
MSAAHDDVRAALEAERAAARERASALERELASALEVAAEGSADDEHDPEGSTTAFERAQVAAVLGQVRERLVLLSDALRRLDEPGFGRCERCGLPIAAGRLAARPWATTCVTCAAAGPPHRSGRR